MQADLTPALYLTFKYSAFLSIAFVLQLTKTYFSDGHIFSNVLITD